MEGGSPTLKRSLSDDDVLTESVMDVDSEYEATLPEDCLYSSAAGDHAANCFVEHCPQCVQFWRSFASDKHNRANGYPLHPRFMDNEE